MEHCRVFDQEMRKTTLYRSSFSQGVLVWKREGKRGKANEIRWNDGLTFSVLIFRMFFFCSRVYVFCFCFPPHNWSKNMRTTSLNTIKGSGCFWRSWWLFWTRRLGNSDISEVCAGGESTYAAMLAHPDMDITRTIKKSNPEASPRKDGSSNQAARGFTNFVHQGSKHRKNNEK